MSIASLPLRTYRSARRGVRKRRPVRLSPAGPARGRVLLSYVADPFLRHGLGRRRPPATNHTHHLESLRMAQTFLGLGFAVDVISYRNRAYTPARGAYDVLVDARYSMERLAEAIGPGCVRIQHMDTAHIAYQNAAEAGRLLDIQRRRGVTLQPRRYEPPTRATEIADAGVYVGNAFTASTYRFAATPLHRARLGGLVPPWPPPERDYRTARRRFLWMSSHGFVLKGLDLVLEAFAELPDHELIVCGPVAGEPDFAAAFHRELRETPNITTLGWVDIASESFRQLVASCAGVVYASGSEGGGGAVINAMHTGLIPVVTDESSVDVDPSYGVLLPDASVRSIRKSVVDLADRPCGELAEMGAAAREFVQTHHTPDRFAREYREAITTLLG